MRKTLLVLILAAVVVWMFQHPDELQEYSNKVFRETSKFFGRMAGDAGHEESPEAAAHGSDELVIEALPENTYCLLQPVRISNAGTSTLLHAGTLVQKTGEGGGKFVISDGTGTTIVEAGMLTRDPAVIRGMMQRLAAAGAAKDSAAQSRVQQQIQEIDGRLMALRAELNSIRTRDREAAVLKRRVHFSTSESYVQSNITMLEKLRAELIKQTPAPRH